MPTFELTHGLRGRRASWLLVAITLILLLPLLAACGGGDDDDAGSTITWQPGLPATSTQPADTADAPPAETQAPDGQAEETAETAPEATEPAAIGTEPPAQSAGTGVTGRPLSEAELAEFQPNELGSILVLEYHQLTDDEDQVAQFVRTYDSFRDDLQWLYDNGFYIVSMREVIENRITAPAGKKPVVLTFDDSPVNQFRYLIGDDGSLTIDPESGVGIMEAFYAEHPDFGRGGMFGVLPNACFYTGVDGAEEDQIDLCSQKITFLIDNGYEVENHTLTHNGIQDVDDETFKEDIAGAIDALKEYDERVEATIFVVPFGMYPDLEKHPQQREWMRNGFEWNGRQYQLIGSLMVGSNPTESPASVAFDSMWIARIQMCDCTEQGGQGWEDTWQPIVADNPAWLYVSDGDPNTVTVPENADTSVTGELDEARMEAEGKTIVRY